MVRTRPIFAEYFALDVVSIFDFFCKIYKTKNQQNFSLRISTSPEISINFHIRKYSSNRKILDLNFE